MLGRYPAKRPAGGLLTHKGPVEPVGDLRQLSPRLRRTPANPCAGRRSRGSQPTGNHALAVPKSSPSDEYSRAPGKLHGGAPSRQWGRAGS